jgi:hypothetical protein
MSDAENSGSDHLQHDEYEDEATASIAEPEVSLASYLGQGTAADAAIMTAQFLHIAGDVAAATVPAEEEPPFP